MKILLSAYACEPNKGSEPGVGWNWAKQIARFHEVWVITRTNNKTVIDKEMQKNPTPNLNFYYADLPKWMRFWKKGNRGLYLYYYLWQVMAYRVVKKLHKEKKFDLAHHITFGNILLPTFIPFLHIPFVWGPLGGGENIPKQFRTIFTLKWRIFESIRDIMQKIFFKADPFINFALKKSRIILVRTRESFDLIPLKYIKKTKLILETGATSTSIHTNNKSLEANNNLKIIYAGRLIHWKGLNLAIEAFANFIKRNKNSIFLIIGDGSYYKNLLKQKESLNINKIYFLGTLPREKTLMHINSSHIYLHPSFKDAGAWGVIEAMQYGLPIICLNLGGPREIVNEKCGIKIRAENPKQVVSDITKALHLLAKNPKLRNKLGNGGKKRAKELYDWDKKGNEIKNIYEEIFKDNASK
jgi:glycosyltransferase involved in cell wall biosynthesis